MEEIAEKESRVMERWRKGEDEGRGDTRAFKTRARAMSCTPLDKFSTIPHGNLPLTVRFQGTKAFYDEAELKSIFEEHGAVAHVRSFGLNVNITYFHPFSIRRFVENDGARAIALRGRTDLLSLSLDHDLAEALWFGGCPHVNDAEEGERLKKHLVALLQSAACAANVNVFLAAELDANRREMIVSPSPTNGKQAIVNFEITSFFSTQKKIFSSNPIKWNNAPRALLVRCADSTYLEEWIRRRDDGGPLTDDEQRLMAETDAHLGNPASAPPAPVQQPEVIVIDDNEVGVEDEADNATPATPANIPADPDVIVIDDEDEDVEPDAPPLKKSRMSIEEMPKNSQPTSTAAGARLPPTKDDAVNVENAVLEAVEEANDENDDNGEANAMQVEDDHQDEFPLQDRSGDSSDDGRSESSSVIFLPTPSPQERLDEVQKGDDPQGATPANDGAHLMDDANLDDTLPYRMDGAHNDSDEQLPTVHNDEPANEQPVQASSVDALPATMGDDLPSTSTGRRGGLEHVPYVADKSQIQEGTPSASSSDLEPVTSMSSKTAPKDDPLSAGPTAGSSLDHATAPAVPLQDQNHNQNKSGVASSADQPLRAARVIFSIDDLDQMAYEPAPQSPAAKWLLAMYATVSDYLRVLGNRRKRLAQLHFAVRCWPAGRFPIAPGLWETSREEAILHLGIDRIEPVPESTPGNFTVESLDTLYERWQKLQSPSLYHEHILTLIKEALQRDVFGMTTTEIKRTMQVLFPKECASIPCFRNGVAAVLNKYTNVKFRRIGHQWVSIPDKPKRNHDDLPCTSPGAVECPVKPASNTSPARIPEEQIKAVVVPILKEPELEKKSSDDKRTASDDCNSRTQFLSAALAKERSSHELHQDTPNCSTHCPVPPIQPRTIIWGTTSNAAANKYSPATASTSGTDSLSVAEFLKAKNALACFHDLAQKPMRRLTYSEMVALALDSSPTGKLRVEDIYEFITANLPELALSKSWTNSVRNALASQKGKRFGWEENGIGASHGLWYILPDCVDKIRAEIAPFRHRETLSSFNAACDPSPSSSSSTKSYPALEAILGQGPIQHPTSSNPAHEELLDNAEKQANRPSTFNLSSADKVMADNEVYLESAEDEIIDEGQVERSDQQAHNFPAFYRVTPILVSIALESSPTKKLPLCAIYEYIEAHFANVIKNDREWKQRVHAALSRGCIRSKNRFGYEGQQRSRVWYIQPKLVKEVREEIAEFRRQILDKTLAEIKSDEYQTETVVLSLLKDAALEMRALEAVSDANLTSEIASGLSGNASKDGDASVEDDDEILIQECSKLFDEIANCDDPSASEEEDDEEDQEKDAMDEEDEENEEIMDDEEKDEDLNEPDDERRLENAVEEKNEAKSANDSEQESDEEDEAESILRRSSRFVNANRQDDEDDVKSAQQSDEEENMKEPTLRRSRRFEPALGKDDEENVTEEDQEEDESPQSSDEEDEAEPKESPSLRRSKRTRKKCTEEGKKQPEAQEPAIEDMWVNAPVAFNRKYKMLLEYNEKMKAVRDALENDDKSTLREAYADLIQMRLIRTLGIFEFMNEYGHRHSRDDLGAKERNKERAYQRSIASVAEKWNEVLPGNIRVYIFDWTGRRSGGKEIRNVEFLNDLVRSPAVQALIAKAKPLKGRFCRNCRGHSRNNSKDPDVFCCQIGLEEHSFLRFVCSRNCEGADQARIDLESKRSVPIGIFRNHKTGWSVRVLTKFVKDQFVTQALGEVNDGPSEDPDHDFPMGYTHPDGETELVIALGEKGNEVRFLNHSCNPNLVVTSMMEERFGAWYCRKYFHAKREILEGEEITFDYVAGKRKMAKNLEIIKTCFCGAAKCYWKTIRG